MFIFSVVCAKAAVVGTASATTADKASGQRRRVIRMVFLQVRSGRAVGSYAVPEGADSKHGRPCCIAMTMGGEATGPVARSPIACASRRVSCGAGPDVE